MMLMKKKEKVVMRVKTMGPKCVWGPVLGGRNFSWGKERIRRGEEEGICCIYTSKDSIMKPSTV
jgi:hypothetical protein